MASTGGSQVRVLRTPALIMITCFVAQLFEGYDIFVYGVTLPSLLENSGWNMSPEFAGVIGSAGVLGMFVGALLVGMLTDVIGRKKMFIVAIVTFSAGMAICAIAPDPEMMLVGRTIVGVGSGGFLPTVLAVVIDASPAHRRTQNVAITGVGIAIGSFASAILGIFVIPSLGYEAMYWAGLVALVTILPLAIFALPESVPFLLSKGRVAEAERIIERHRLPFELVEGTEQAQPATQLRGVRLIGALFAEGRARATTVFWVGISLLMLLIFGVNTWLPTIMVEAGYGFQSSLTFFVALNIGIVVGSLIASYFADMFGPKAIVLLGFALAALALTALALQPPVWLIYALLTVAGFGTQGTANILNSYITSYYPPQMRGTGAGVALAVGRVGGIIGPLWGGVLIASGGGTKASFFGFVAPAVIACIVLLFAPSIAGSLRVRAGAAKVDAPA